MHLVCLTMKENCVLTDNSGLDKPSGHSLVAFFHDALSFGPFHSSLLLIFSQELLFLCFTIISSSFGTV